MLIVLYLLLMLRVGRCSDDLIFGTKTVGVGDDVTLTCARQKSEYTATLFWIRLVSGNMPLFLGGTFAFDYDGFNKTPRITAKQDHGTFLLHISKAKLSDTGVYYCIKVDRLNMTFVQGTLLRMKGTEPNITAVIQMPPSDPVRPGDSVTLQCSVLYDSENRTCPGDPSVYWFRAGSHESHPSVIYAHGNSDDQCEKSPEARSPQKCVYSFSKNVSSSDAGTYYCAVATCGQILFGNGTKLDIQAVNMWDSQRAKAILFLLCAALAISLIVIAFLISSIKACDCCNGTATTGGVKNQHLRNLRKDEDTRIYSAVVFAMMKTGSGGTRGSTAAERERIDPAFKAFGLN